MKNLILLTAMLLSSVSVYATCVPPVGGKDNPCECAYPVFENGSLKCGPTYCPSGTTCMSNGACCSEPNNARTQCCDEKGNGVANDDTCCPALETAGCETEVDTTTGCSVCKMDFTEICEAASGSIRTANNGDVYCRSKDAMNWSDAQSWCSSNGMVSPTIYEMCPGFDGTTGSGTCPNLANIEGSGDAWSSTLAGSDKAYSATLSGGSVYTTSVSYRTELAIMVGFCRL